MNGRVLLRHSTATSRVSREGMAYSATRETVVSRVAYIVLTVSARGLGVVFALSLTFALTSAEYGKYAFVLQTATAISAIGLLGLPNIINVRLSRASGKAVVDRAMLGLLALSAVSCLAGALIGYWAFGREALGVGPLVLVALTVSLLAYSVSNSVLHGLRRYKSAAVSGVIAALAPFGLYVTHGRSAGQALVWQSTAGATLLACVICIGLAFFVRGGRSAPVEEAGERAAEARTHGKAVTITILSLASTWIVQQHVFRGGGASGYASFAVATQFLSLFTMLPATLAPYLTSQFASRIPADRCRLRDKLFVASSAASAIIAFAAIVGILVADGMLPEVYGKSRFEISLALAAGAVQLAKAPISIFFFSELDLAPEMNSAIILSLVGLLGALFLPGQSDAMSVVRLAAITSGAAVVVYYWAKRRRGESWVSRS